MRTYYHIISLFSTETFCDYKRKCLITHRMRSMEQGNVFTGACHSVHGVGVCLTTMPRQTASPAGKQTILRRQTVNRRAVSILLECILVVSQNFIMKVFLWEKILGNILWEIILRLSRPHFVHKL